ncbi:MAG: citrate lyase holo-[acyl-carrier protein] synthase [Ancalomicrobiaceae bacterium]|nr:citrate lyase holo-[acyl-carrier protein] synthase [Ancalomicrobiaceae bacterium]
MPEAARDRSHWRTGRQASLDELLAARDARAERRAALLAATRRPIVTVTTVMPGPVKDCELSRIPFVAALAAIEALASQSGWTATTHHCATPVTGPEAFVALDAPAVDIKRALVDLEEAHPLGRLFDLDVAAADGHTVGRADLGLPARHCLVCDKPAKECGRSRAHTLDALLTRMEDRIDVWLCSPA